MRAERAKITDVPAMHKLINHFAERGEMLARPLSEIYENIRDYFVVRDGAALIGCAALHVNWSDLAEVRSVAVAEDHQHTGVGSKVVQACLRRSTRAWAPHRVLSYLQACLLRAIGLCQGRQDGIAPKGLERVLSVRQVSNLR